MLGLVGIGGGDNWRWMGVDGVGFNSYLLESVENK